MHKLVMASWKKGSNSVGLILAVRNHSANSLATAKAMVEGLLAGRAIELEFSTESERDEFRKAAESHGAIFDS